MNEPLAFKLKPEKLDDIIGQKHLVGENGIIRKCLNQKRIFSMIFFGPPGIGKTSLAKVIANELGRPYRSFNATTGNKKDLDAIFAEAKLSGTIILICDEVHRLNKDKQDLLLPHIENGSIILIGATTENPYFSINPAIRSRCHLFELQALNNDDIKEAINRALVSPKGLNNEYTIDQDAIEQIANTVNGDLRFALNILEISAISCDDKHITKDVVKEYCRFVNNRSSADGDGYYNLLSAFQKSIRGSDVNAALYYLNLLAQANDMKSINRRLLVTAYEDIGLANPALCARTLAACETAERVGFPEAIIPLGVQIIDLCLAPKSKAGHNAVKAAEALVNQHAYDMPKYLNLTPVNVEEKYQYDAYDKFHLIQYLPDPIKDVEFLKLGHSQYEKQLVHNYEELKRFPRTNDLKALYKKK